MKENMKENIQRIWGESLKSLKSLMQIFAESANSANSAKQIFATFATFAMQIFSNFVNLVKLVMQIFHKGSYSAVRVSSVQQPTNIQRISNLSPTVSTVKVAQKSRITRSLPAFAMVAMMVFGVNMNVWGRTSSVNTADLWVASTYDAGDSVVWSASNVTFKLHNGGNIKLESSDHILIQKAYTYKLEWRVASGKTINVTGVSVRVRSTMNKSYMTVGSVTSGNVGPDVGIGVYTTVSSGALSLGNNGYVSLRPESGNGSAIFHMDEITVTYTMDGVEKEVTFDGTKYWGSTKEEYDPTSFDVDSPHVTFSLKSPMKQYNKYSWFTFSSHEYFFLQKSGDSDVTSQLRWDVKDGYTIRVLSISTSAKNGNGYVWTSRMSQGARKAIAQSEGSWTSHTYAVSDASNNLFGSTPIALGNNEYFNIDVTTKGKYSQVHIKTIDLTYTINPNSYDITLNNETPTTEVTTSVSVTYDSNNQLSITLPTKDGYTLDGWYTSETDGNGSGTKVIDANGFLQTNVTGYTGASGVWKKTTATTLYAKWILNGIKDIMLEDQGATTAGTDSLSVRFMTDHYSKASISAPAKTGYTFDGYYSASSDGVQVIDADGNVVADVEGYTDSDKKWINGDDETTLYAHWTGISYSVRFNGNGSTDGSMSNQAFVYGTAQSLTTIGFEKTCTVTYDANGGSCGIASSETPFSFLGWATSAGGDVVYVNGASVNNLTTTSGATVDLYAKWSAEADAVELPTATKTGYPFAGWYDSEDVCVGQAGDYIIPTGDATLLAHWTPYVIVKNTDFSSTNGKKSFSWDGIHCTFTLSSTGNMTYTGAAGTQHTSIGKECNTSISWIPTNSDCDITVTYYKIVCGNPGTARDIYVNGEKYGTMGLFATNYKVEGKISAGTSDSIFIMGSDVIDIYSIELWYTVTPKSPIPHNADLAATLDEEDKKTLDVRVNSEDALFTMVDPASDFTYSYRLGADYGTHAQIEGNNFWADATGDYEVQARVDADEDHVASAWSTCTIHVVRTCVFNNKKGDKNWETTDNWAYNAEPTADDAVLVLDSLTVDKEIEMLSLSIEGDGVVTIAPNGGLTVGAGGITGASKDKLILKAQTVDDDVKGIEKGQTGFLRISPEYTGEMPEATVEMYSKAVHKNAPGAGATSSFQCVGAPIADLDVPAKTVFPAGTWLYTWDEDGGESGTWVNTRSSMNFTPFQGFDISQKKSANGYLFKFEGHLVSGAGAAKVIALDSTYRGNNLLANSFTAPIDITSFDSEDFDNAHQTIYILNSGAKGQGVEAKGIDSPGKWFGVPINSAAEMAKDGYPCIIPSMQGFWVQAKTGGGSIKLDYSKLVWGKTYVDSLANKPLRAPRRGGYASESMPITGRLKIDIYGGEESDCLYMLESERYDRAYEDGYDANKMEGDGVEIFTIEGESEFSVNATNSIIGTRVGVRTGEETAYTLEFSRFSAENELALRDNETNEEIDIYEGLQYTFFAEPNSEITGRFIIVEREGAPAVATGNDKVTSDVRAHKFIKDSQLFILKNGVLYDATGARVK